MSLTIKQRIVNMRMAGASYEDIERELNCERSVISYHLNRDTKVNVSKKMRREHASELEAIQAYKERMGCIDCGSDYPHFILEFDHLPEFKKFGVVGHILKKYGPDKAWEEIAKCDVVCSNCHKLRSHSRQFPEYDAILDS